jgi:hypothetical protein
MQCRVYVRVAVLHQPSMLHGYAFMCACHFCHPLCATVYVSLSEGSAAGALHCMAWILWLKLLLMNLSVGPLVLPAIMLNSLIKQYRRAWRKLALLHMLILGKSMLF